ncbi:MAG: PhoH family protein, partial [archaeon]
RNLENTIWVITEAQNIDPIDTDMIVSRIGKNSKLIIEGDIKGQINKRNLNYQNNGLRFISDSLKKEKKTGTIILEKNERSKTSQYAKILRNKLRER